MSPEPADQAPTDMPPETRSGRKDAEVLGRIASVLLPLRDAFVRGFCDLRFAHPETRAVF